MTKKSQSDQGQARDIPANVTTTFVDSDDIRENYNKISDAYYFDYVPELSPGEGTFAPKGDSTWGDSLFDLRGLTGQNWRDQYYNSGKSTQALVVFHHSDYDSEEGDNGKKYSLVVYLETCKNTHADDDAGSGREWFLDHISGDIQNGEVQVGSSWQDPTRKNAAQTGGNNPKEFHVGVTHRLLVGSNKAAAVAVRGFEKDNNEFGTTDDYQPGFSDWVELMKDLRKFITKGKPINFVLDASVMLVKEIIASNEDDPMNPSMMVFSQGACRFIKEQCGGEINFTRENVYGLRQIVGIVTSGPGSNMQNLQLAQATTSRHYDLDYQVTVTEAVTIDPNKYYRIKHKKTGKVLNVSGASMEDGAELDQWDDVGVDQQLFRFESLGNENFHIIAKHSGLNMVTWKRYPEYSAHQYSESSSYPRVYNLIHHGDGVYTIRDIFFNLNLQLGIYGSTENGVRALFAGGGPEEDYHFYLVEEGT